MRAVPKIQVPCVARFLLFGISLMAHVVSQVSCPFSKLAKKLHLSNSNSIGSTKNRLKF